MLFLLASVALAFELPSELADTWHVTADAGTCPGAPDTSRVWRCEPDEGFSACIVVGVPMRARAETVLAHVQDIEHNSLYFPKLVFALDDPGPIAADQLYRVHSQGSDREAIYRFTAVDKGRMAGELIGGATGLLAAMAYDHRVIDWPDGALSVEQVQLRTKAYAPGWLVGLRRIATGLDCEAQLALKARLEGEQADPPAEAGALAPALAAAGGGAWATWWEPSVDGHRLQASRYGLEGWSGTVTITQGDDLFVNWADTPMLGVGGDGTLLASWPQKSGQGTYSYDVSMARSIDGGGSWQALGLLHDDGTETEHGFVSMVGAADGVQVAWLDGRGSADGGPMTLRTAEVGHEVQAGAELDPMVCDCCPTAMALASSGPVVAYRDRSEDEVRDPFVVRWTDAGWSAPQPVHSDGWVIPGCPVNGPRVIADGDRVTVAWFTGAATEPEVRLARSEDGGETFAEPVVVSAGPDVLGRVDLVADGADALVLWMERSGEDSAVVTGRRVHADGRGGAAIVLGHTSATRSSGVPRAVGVHDQLLVTWTILEETTALRAKLFDAVAFPRGWTMLPAPLAAEPEIHREIRLPDDLDATLLDGSALEFEPGKPVLLNLWATWCAPCLEELPLLVALHQRFADRGVSVVGLAVDDEATAVASVVARSEIAYRVALTSSEAVRKALQSDSVPTTLLFDSSGELAWVHEGALSSEEAIADLIEAALEN